MSFDLKSLELFVRVATLGALGRAGEELHLSPTATTQRIQMLEAELGAKLLNRTTRAVSLTPDGEVFLEHAKKVLESVEDARNAVSTSQDRVSGELRVTTSAAFGRSQIIPHIGAFLTQFPDVTLKLDLNDTVVDIIEQGYDLAIRVGVLTSSTLLARKLAPNPRLLVATPAYLKMYGVPKTPSDLKSHNCIVLGETRNWALQDQNGNISEVRVHGSFTTNFGEAVTETVRQSVGIGLKSIWDISEQLDNGELVRVLPHHTVSPDWQIWAVRPPGRVAPPRVQVFTRFLEDQFRRTGLGQIIP